MSKIQYFEVEQEGGQRRLIDANEFQVDGEYVGFFEITEGLSPRPGDTSPATLPTRRLLTMVHRPREVTPVYDE